MASLDTVEKLKDWTKNNTFAYFCYYYEDKYIVDLAQKGAKCTFSTFDKNDFKGF